MGTRTVFQLFDGGRQLVASLFANCSHTTQFAEEVFASTLKDPCTADGPNALAERLLSLRYGSDEGNHRAGDRIFWLVPHDVARDGDVEAIVAAIHRGGAEELVARGYVSRKGRGWLVERRTVQVDAVGGLAPAAR